MTVGSLLIGVVGFHVLEGWAWIDAFLGSSMLLSGMGPTLVPTTELGKLFAAFYAMFSGVLYLSVSAVLLAPFFHRVMHKMSVEAS